MKNKNRKKLRKIWEKINGKIPIRYELHHILPIWEGGKDEIENLIPLSFEEHKKIHYERYLQNGKIEDLLASKIGISNDEIRIMRASLGGKIGGQKQLEMKIGIHSQTKDERLHYASLGGKCGAFTNKQIQSKLGKRGGANNKGFIWINDGTNSIKYTKKMQLEKPISDFLNENKNYNIGRICEKEQCKYCGIICNKLTICRYHNDKCKHVESTL